MGGGALEKKAHLVKWEVMCSGKGLGGLGLRNLTLMNKALLGKWMAFCFGPGLHLEKAYLF